MVRRLIDIGVSLSLLVVLSPLFIVTAILVKISSPGPILFCQERYGIHRSVFVVWKFRALKMHVSEGRVEDMVGTHDPRITRIGAFLRRYKFDELPQLVNVLRGDMTIIGPRSIPMRESDHFERLIPGFLDRLQVKPGLTGLKQVWRFKSEAQKTRENFLRLDLIYVYNRSLFLDIYILARTIPLFLRGELN